MSTTLGLEKPQKCDIQKTASGTWRTLPRNGKRVFGSYSSHWKFWERPVLSVAYGVDPESKQMALADGWIAIGQRARGFIAIGQFVNGTLAVGQFATARVAAIGQFVDAPVGIGQFTIAVAAIGQMGIGGTGIFQTGLTFFGGIGQQIVDLNAFLPWLIGR